MNEAELNRMFKQAASAVPEVLPATMESTIMARVLTDDGRARRWRSFVKWLLILVLVSGGVTAALVCGMMAARDKTHAEPPPMNLFREGVAP